MKKIKDTKSPTVRQMISMSENLRGKFGKYSSIMIETHAHTSSEGVDVEYRFYVENGKEDTFKSWKELLSFYHEVMKEES